MNKVRAAFRPSGFGVILRSGSAGTKDLVGDMPRLESPWEAARKLDYARGEVNQPVLKLIGTCDLLQHHAT